MKKLEEENFIYSIPYKGCFVGSVENEPRRTSNFAALIFPDDELYYYKIFAKLEPFFHQNGQILSVHLTDNSAVKERQLLEMFSAKKFDVLVAVPNAECRDAYKKSSVPVVFFDSVIADLNIPGVISDDIGGAFHATRHLLSLGHRRIAFIGHDYDLSGKNRLAGYIDALKKARLEIDPGLIKLSQPSREWGIAAMEEIFSRRDGRPTAVFCVNDTVAAGVIHYAQRRHWKIPEDISISSFGNTSIADDLDLSSVDQNIDKIVDAIKLKVRQVMSDKDFTADNIEVPCSLIVRSSCAFCKQMSG